MAIGICRGSLESSVHASGRTRTVLTSPHSDVDLSEVQELALVEVAYLAGLAATARVVQPSLASFLR